MPRYVTNQGPIVADAPDPSWRLTENGIYIVPSPPPMPYTGIGVAGPWKPTPTEGKASWDQANRAVGGYFTPQAGLELTQNG